MTFNAGPIRKGKQIRDKYCMLKPVLRVTYTNKKLCLCKWLKGKDKKLQLTG